MKKQILYFIIVILFSSIQSAVLAVPVALDVGGAVGGYTSITIVNGNPAISYCDLTNGNLKYVITSNTEGTVQLAPITVDSAGYVGEHTSIAVVNGNPAISYYDATNGNLKYVRASNANGTAWGTPIIVDSTSHVGKYTSMTIVNGFPAISYYDSTNKALKYVRARDANGTLWWTPLTVNKGKVGLFSSLTIVANHPAISYYDINNSDLKYVRANNVWGSVWGTPFTVDSKDDVGWYSSMTVVNGKPAISYYDVTNKDLNYVRASDAYGTAWGTPVAVDSDGDIGFSTSMTIINGSPAISYFDGTNKDLKYVRASDDSGTIWHTPVTIDSVGDVGYYTSLTNINGNPAISYYDSTKANLKYARLMNLYFPHIASSAPWETEICIINTSRNRNIAGTIKAYNDSGALVTSKPVSLPPNGRTSIIVGTELSNPSNIGYIVFESDSTSVYGYTKFHVVGKYRVAIPATSRINTNNIYIPHIASNDQWWTGLSLVNTTAFTKTLTIESNNGITKTVSLGAHAHKKFTLGSLFAGVSQPEIKSAVIKNAKGVIGLELFGSSAGTGKNYLSGILLKDEATTDIYYPHVATDATWWTGIVAYNPAASSANLTITPYKSDGTKLSSKAIVLQSKEKYMGTPGTLNLPTGTAWFHIHANKAITGFELFGTNNGKQLAGYTVVNINAQTGLFPKLEKNGWTGIAFVNIANMPANVTMKAFNDSGLLIATKQLVLKAHEKVLGVTDTLFGTSLANATYITYKANQDIVGFQLSGSTDKMQLDALPGN